MKFAKEEKPTDSLYAKGVILYFRDGIDVVSDHIHQLLDKIEKYTDFISDHLYVDGMTGLGNRKAYIKKVKEINVQLSKGYATYDSTKDKNFGDVFHRAEENLLKDKQ